MALETDCGMKFLPELNYLGLITLQEGNFMETMAIAAIRGIRVSSENGFAMAAFQEAVISMAGRAFLNDSLFLPLPWGHIVNIFMAVFALNVIDEVGACVMFSPLLFMTAMAGHGLCVNSGALCLSMGFHICNVPVAAITGVGSMDGLGKFSFIDLIAVTTETIGIINAFVTVFPAPDHELLPFFRRIRRLGHSSGLGWFFFLRSGCGCPHQT